MLSILNPRLEKTVAILVSTPDSLKAVIDIVFFIKGFSWIKIIKFFVKDF
jgi:hypothetical protein